MANLLSAHRDLANPQHRAEVAALWGVADVPATPGKTAVEMFEAAADGEIKALWIACTNPAQSMPDQATVRRALERAEFVVRAGGLRDHRHLRLRRSRPRSCRALPARRRRPTGAATSARCAGWRDRDAPTAGWPGRRPRARPSRWAGR